MTKDQAMKLLNVLISNSEALHEKQLPKNLKKFKFCNPYGSLDTMNKIFDFQKFIDLLGSIDNYEVSLVISLSTDDNYQLILRFLNIYDPSDLTAYIEHDFKKVIELVNLKLKSNIDIETFCQTPLDYLNKLFVERKDILVITNKDETRFSVTRLDYEHELTIENINKVYNSFNKKPQRISEIYINQCTEQWIKINFKSIIMCDCKKQIVAKELNRCYNELANIEKELFINRITEPTFAPEYLAYLGVDSDLVERYKKQYLKDYK